MEMNLTKFLEEMESMNYSYLSIRTFNKHQTYQFDNPGFVKLKTKLLFDDEFAGLSEQSQLLYLKLLLHAAFTANRIPDRLDWMADKLSMPTLTQASLDALKTEDYLVDYDPSVPVTAAEPGDDEVSTGKRSKASKVSLSEVYSNPDFNTYFWDPYLRKEAKPRAAQAWAKLVKSGVITPEILPIIKAAIERQKLTDQWKRGIIPHPSTWLNNHRWEDEVEVVAPSVPAAHRLQKVAI